MAQWTVEGVQRALHLEFRKPDILRAVFHNQCAGVGRRHPLPSRQELAYIGDAEIEAVMRTFVVLSRRMKQRCIENWRTFVVSNRFLDEVAHRSGLYDWWMFGDLAEPTVRAGGTIYEALIGAIVVDRGPRFGPPEARNYLRRTYLRQARVVLGQLNRIQLVSKFRNIAHEQGKSSQFPLQRLDNGGPRYAVIASIPGICSGRGRGNSILEADSSAALSALTQIGVGR